MTSRPVVMELLAHALFVVLAVVVAYRIYTLWNPVLGAAS